jgi:phage tail tape-measure protein
LRSLAGHLETNRTLAELRDPGRETSSGGVIVRQDQKREHQGDTLDGRINAVGECISGGTLGPISHRRQKTLTLTVLRAVRIAQFAANGAIWFAALSRSGNEDGIMLLSLDGRVEDLGDASSFG